MSRERYTPEDDYELGRGLPWSQRVATAADAITYAGDGVIEGDLYYFHRTGGVRGVIEAAD